MLGSIDRLCKCRSVVAGVPFLFVAVVEVVVGSWIILCRNGVELHGVHGVDEFCVCLSFDVNQGVLELDAIVVQDDVGFGSVSSCLLCWLLNYQ